MSSPDRQDGSGWDVLGPEVPADLNGVRVLDAGVEADAATAALTERGAEVVRFDAAADQGDDYELVYCRGLLETHPHPMNLLSRFWHLSAAGALLLLESAVLTDPQRSRYAEFVRPEAGGAGRNWLPGRLALRWSVETSGFAMERWLGAELADRQRGDPVGVAYLRAIRTDRTPALDLATPSPGQ